MSAVLALLESRSRPFLVVSSAAIVFAVAVADYVTGPYLRFFIFYWPPIAVVAWYVGRRWAAAFVALCGAAWFLANAVENLGSGDVRLITWNATVNVASFVLLAVLVVRLHDLVARERSTARTDYTTGVANARAFAEAMEAASAHSRRTAAPFTVAYLDLDDFKTVNDRLGHAAGDELLRAIGGMLRAHVRASDTVARLGGDEFGVLFPATGETEAGAAVDRLVAAFRGLERARGWGVTASIGVVTCVPGPCRVDEVIRRADELMYEAKTTVKGTVRRVVMRSDGELSTETRVDSTSTR